MARHIPTHDPDAVLNFELFGYDELDRYPTIGRISDRESFLEVPERPARSVEAESRPRAQREFLANDFSIGGF